MKLPVQSNIDKNVTSAPAIGFAQWLKDCKEVETKGDKMTRIVFTLTLRYYFNVQYVTVS